MSTSQSQWYWDGAWHPVSKKEWEKQQMFTVSVNGVVIPPGAMGFAVQTDKGLELLDISQNWQTPYDEAYLQKIREKIVLSGVISFNSGQMPENEADSENAGNHKGKPHSPPQKPT